MATRKDRGVLRQLSTLFNIGAIRELTDGQLLERFATGRGEAADLAFTALVERHGAMVLRVCRSVLVDPHETQDAFQATFLILVKKARGLWVRDSLGPWLHQVAFRTASCSKSARVRRQRLERGAAERATSLDDAPRLDLEQEQMLHEEINRLPERYRVAIVLCDLQGYTCEDAARQMGRPVGTVKSWRSRARERWRTRLIQRGLAPSAGLALTISGESTRAAGAKEIVGVVLNRLTAGEVPATVQVLVKGVLTTMFFSKLRMTAATILALAVFTAGLGTIARVAADDTAKQAESPAPRPDRDVPTGLNGKPWSLTLREAINIGLDNSAVVRVISIGGQSPANGFSTPSKMDYASESCVIGRLSRDVDVPGWRSEVMAEVRSIEQSYWQLAQQYSQLGASEKAVELAEETLKREQEELKAGRGHVADIPEIQQRLDQFRLDLLCKSSDVITTERQLRNLLGLPLADARRIVPSSQPVEAKVDPDWDQSLATMLEKQPDIEKQKANVKLRAVRVVEERGAGQTRAEFERERTFLEQVIQQTTRSLDRFFLELNANYKQFKTASRFRVAAAERLKAQRAFYEEGRITVDRYLDAVSQYTSAIAQESQFKTSYNISIIALEEAQGTLLEHEQITVAEGPKPVSPYVTKQDPAAKTASYEPAVPATLAPPPLVDTVENRPASVSPPVSAAPAKEESPKVDLDGKTVSFQFTVGRGPKPIEVRGSFTISPAPKAR